MNHWTASHHCTAETVESTGMSCHVKNICLTYVSKSKDVLTHSRTHARTHTYTSVCVYVSAREPVYASVCEHIVMALMVYHCMLRLHDLHSWTSPRVLDNTNNHETNFMDIILHRYLFTSSTYLNRSHMYFIIDTFLPFKI